jgi:hypothetical protein
VAAFGPLDLHYRDSGLFQVAGESGPVAAGPFHTSTPYGAEAFRPTEELPVALGGGGHLDLAQASAQRVEDHTNVEVQVRVHPQHHLRHVSRSTRAARRHSAHSFRCGCQLLCPM